MPRQKGACAFKAGSPGAAGGDFWIRGQRAAALDNKGRGAGPALGGRQAARPGRTGRGAGPRDCRPAGRSPAGTAEAGGPGDADPGRQVRPRGGASGEAAAPGARVSARRRADSRAAPGRGPVVAEGGSSGPSGLAEGRPGGDG